MLTIIKIMILFCKKRLSFVKLITNHTVCQLSILQQVQTQQPQDLKGLNNGLYLTLS